MQTNANYVPNRHFEFFETLDEVLSEQDKMTEELKEAVNNNWVDEYDAEEAEIIYRHFGMVFGSGD